MPDDGLPYAPTALSDPTGARPLVDAALWVQHALLGTAATLIATLAIATIGFLALSGRIDLRRGATAVIGCFILFGAPSIAAGFLQIFQGGDTTSGSIATAIATPTPPTPQHPTVYDPYAGASVERR